MTLMIYVAKDAVASYLNLHSLLIPHKGVILTANRDRDTYKPLWKFLLNLLSNYEVTVYIH